MKYIFLKIFLKIRRFRTSKNNYYPINIDNILIPTVDYNNIIFKPVVVNYYQKDIFFKGFIYDLYFCDICLAIKERFFSISLETNSRILFTKESSNSFD